MEKKRTRLLVLPKKASTCRSLGRVLGWARGRTSSRWIDQNSTRSQYEYTATLRYKGLWEILKYSTQGKRIAKRVSKLVPDRPGIVIIVIIGNSSATLRSKVLFS